MRRNEPENQPSNEANTLKHSDSAKGNISIIKENIKDITTVATTSRASKCGICRHEVWHYQTTQRKGSKYSVFQKNINNIVTC